MIVGPFATFCFEDFKGIWLRIVDGSDEPSQA